MGRRETDNRVQQVLLQRRENNENERLRRIQQCRAAQPRLAQIDTELSTLAFAAARAAMSGKDTAAEDFAKHSAVLQKEYTDILIKMGKPADYLDEIYDCPKCKDTGIADGKVCECAAALSAKFNAESVNGHSALSLCKFEDFSLDYYSDATDPKLGVSPREHMSDVLQTMRDYADGFSADSKSLLLWGNPGLGKTHLALAAAGEIIKKGYSVAYIPSHTLFLQLEKERFARDGEDEDTVEATLDCDLLVLDDLGTEFASSFVQMQLYNIINTRLLDRKPTVISTNLEISELREKYPPRIVSRLIGEYVDLLFIGKDIRIAKKYKD